VVGNWRDEFLKQSSLPEEEAAHFPMLMIGNKIDVDDRVVSRRQAKAWAEQHSSDRMQIGCFETSAKEGTNVEKAFRYLAHMVKIPQLELDMNNPDGEEVLALTPRANRQRSSGGFCCS
jgi:Ras-related protein Rab-7A